MHALEQVFADIVAGGLRRQSVKLCSQWAQAYRVRKGRKWGYGLHPWSRAMADSNAPYNVGMKAAQMAYTETLLNRTFFKMDIEGSNCLYVFPNKNPDASDFSASRFDPALEESEHLRAMFSDVRNVGHKRAGSANLWIRGSRSRIGLKSIDPSFIALDEVDEMDEQGIQLAMRRADGQEESQLWGISTPTVPEGPIHKMFLSTTQEYWFFQCPNCWKEITLEFPDCFVLIGESLTDPRINESHVICPLCRKKIEHEDKIKSQVETGRWIPRAEQINPNRRGFYVNQLASCVKKPYKIAETAIEALYKPHAEQELWNSIAGLPHVVKGGRIDDEHIDQCMTDRLMDSKPAGYKIRTMGIDVGKWLHYEIDGWSIPKLGPDLNLVAECELIKCGKVEHFHELYTLIREYNVNFVVIDKQPEERAALELCTRIWGRGKRCWYARGVGAKKMTVSASEEDHLINVNRTYWLDTSLGRVRSGRIRFPRDLPQEYRQNLKSLVKKYEEDKSGEDTSKYIKTDADHYAHARNYSEMALPLAASVATNQNIRSFL